MWSPSVDIYLPCFGPALTHARTQCGLLGVSDWASSRLPFLIHGKSIEDPGLELGLIELRSLCSLIAAKSVLSSQHLVHTLRDQGESSSDQIGALLDATGTMPVCDWATWRRRIPSGRPVTETGFILFWCAAVLSGATAMTRSGCDGDVFSGDQNF